MPILHVRYLVWLEKLLEVDWEKKGTDPLVIEDQNAKRPIPLSIPQATFNDLGVFEAKILFLDEIEK